LPSSQTQPVLHLALPAGCIEIATLFDSRAHLIKVVRRNDAGETQELTASYAAGGRKSPTIGVSVLPPPSLASNQGQPPSRAQYTAHPRSGQRLSDPKTWRVS